MADSKAVLQRRDARVHPPDRVDAEARYAGSDTGTDTEWIPIAALDLSHSPRSAGENGEHIRVLAESQADLPPIVVQRGTHRVIDGAHRVRAAQLRGEETIRAHWFDGDDASAFVLAVRLNVRHGLPLSLADRKAAGTRILCEQEGWSNRAIASSVGLSPKTIAALREAIGRPGGQTRLGRDGRVRPVSTAAGRERAKEMLRREPTSSLRAVSAVAGVSPGTVRDVRDQLHRESRAVIPDQRRVPPARRAEAPRAQGAPSGSGKLDRSTALLRSLRTDPSLRFNQSGRLLLSILAVAAIDPQAQEGLVLDLPDHCLDFVAELAQASVQAWQDLATRLSQRRAAPPGQSQSTVNTERRENREA
ncbi:lambda repressor-like predicted transcriptional regulator [Streptomyces canus]|uniref:ParB/RepB/Spo0J family partition protein n=1 Tax=Streptomyces canus TaxID=58343 RepID=UPI002789E26B|nr:ParB/RepB/Spo0J family partition protein [Streptomyces canus]MDQ0596079.1 lambda repressor-like predicted transcriptional regulator [Streptomyces canus]